MPGKMSFALHGFDKGFQISGCPAFQDMSQLFSGTLFPFSFFFLVVAAPKKGSFFFSSTGTEQLTEMLIRGYMLPAQTRGSLLWGFLSFGVGAAFVFASPAGAAVEEAVCWARRMRTTMGATWTSRTLRPEK